MSHTLNHAWFHVVWSTKQRAPLIDTSCERLLYPYLEQRFEEQRCRLIALNGMPDHVHALVAPCLERAPSSIMQHVKGASAFWLNRKVGKKEFAWQTGYALFTVSPDAVKSVARYIERPKEHHRGIGLADELAQLAIQV
ncbi:IS200/IS605 family transposase [Flaviaesturariibacter amylovorans]|uniref:Transposase IS200-like domain-containing protein n=1 Tax=Flaviaesturariibacter amylovorans TaxID=1084520 RepID=A0ABP8GAB6_9BACT